MHRLREVINAFNETQRETKGLIQIAVECFQSFLSFFYCFTNQNNKELIKQTHMFCQKIKKEGGKRNENEI